MDYIREELLRQQRVLAALMTGEDRAEKRAPEKEPAPDRADETAWEETAGRLGPADGADTAGRLGKETSPAWAGYAETGLGEGAKGGAAEKTAAPERWETVRARERWLGDGGSLKAKSEAAGAAWQAAAGSVGESGDSWPSGGGALWAALPASGGLADARTLSRAFQRDARRYDGGFSLY